MLTRAVREETNEPLTEEIDLINRRQRRQPDQLTVPVPVPVPVLILGEGEFARRRETIERKIREASPQPAGMDSRPESAPPELGNTGMAASTPAQAESGVIRMPTEGNLTVPRPFKVPFTATRRPGKRAGNLLLQNLQKKRREKTLLGQITENQVLAALAAIAAANTPGSKGKSAKGKHRKQPSSSSSSEEGTSSYNTVDDDESYRHRHRGEKRAPPNPDQEVQVNVQHHGELSPRRPTSGTPRPTSTTSQPTRPILVNTDQRGFPVYQPLSYANPFSTKTVTSTVPVTSVAPSGQYRTSSGRIRPADRHKPYRPPSRNPGGGGSGNPDGGGGGNPGGGFDDISVVSTDIDMDKTPGLHQVFKRIAKPVKILADPNKVNNPRQRESLQRNLDKVTPSYVRTNLDHDLQGLAGDIQENIEENVRELENELKKELAEVRRERRQVRTELESAKNLMARVARLEENERLTSRVTTEKKDEVLPNVTYAMEDADEDLFRKATISLAAFMKIIEKKYVYEKDPYNWVMAMAMDSNKVATMHKLTKRQQRDLVLNAIPPGDANLSYFGMCDTLDDLFKVISVLASNILTISDLEKAINGWTLNNTDDRTMYKSLTTLLDLLKRSMEHRNRDAPINYPELFRQAITRIQRDPHLPVFVHKALNEGRLRIRDTDRIPDLNQIIVGSLNGYIGMKPKNIVKTGGIANGGKKESISKVYALEYNPTQVTPSILHDSCTPPKTQQTQQSNGTQKKQNPKNAPPISSKSAPSTPNTKKKFSGGQQGNKRYSKFKFVEPWPTGKRYVSKNGNALTKECEEHFHGFCFRCGHSSHTSDNCKIYPDKTVFLTLCDTCKQGFHEECRSKRWKVRESFVNRKIEELSDLCKKLSVNPGTQYMITNPATTDDSDSD